MAYADLATIQDTDPGDILTAAWCDQVRDNGEFLIDPPVCSVYASSSQTVPTATMTVLTADGENFDNDSMHSTSSNTSRITIQTAGRYLLIATAIFATGSADERNVQFYVNGTTALEGTKVNANASGSQNTVITTSRSYVFAENDYVEVRVRQRTGGDLDVGLNEFFASFLTR